MVELGFDNYTVYMVDFSSTYLWSTVWKVDLSSGCIHCVLVVQGLWISLFSAAWLPGRPARLAALSLPAESAVSQPVPGQH